MTEQSFVTKIRAMSNEQLDSELMSHQINDTGRLIILNEISLRNSRDIVKNVPWYVALSVVISVIALAISVISNWQSLTSWFGA